MTIDEMKNELDAYCGAHYSCVNDATMGTCPLHDGNSSCTLNFENDDNVIQSYYKVFPKAITEEIPTEVEPLEHDVINRPNHYCREGGMECIEEMVLIFGKEVVKHFCLCNIWKYRYRSTAKNGEEDIKKSDRYVQIYRGLCSDER